MLISGENRSKRLFSGTWSTLIEKLILEKRGTKRFIKGEKGGTRLNVRTQMEE